MAEMEKARSALAEIRRAGNFGIVASTPFAVSERWPLAMVQIAAVPNVPLPRSEIESHLGLPLPPPHTASGDGRRAALWTGPERWLVAGERAANAGLAEELARRAGGAAAVTDLGHARSVIRLAGSPAPTVLAKGCALDLGPASMRPGRVAATALARLPIFLHAVEDRPAFDIYVYRSYAQSLWDWLLQSAAEFGPIIMEDQSSPREIDLQ